MCFPFRKKTRDAWEAKIGVWLRAPHLLLLEISLNLITSFRLKVGLQTPRPGSFYATSYRTVLRITEVLASFVRRPDLNVRQETGGNSDPKMALFHLHHVVRFFE